MQVDFILYSNIFSIQNFCGSVFLLPQSIIKDAENKGTKFLWGDNEVKKKVSLVKWHTICGTKAQDGLNINSWRLWNVVAVGKMVWWLHYHCISSKTCLIMLYASLS